MFDAYVSQPSYADHLIGLWKALEPHERGVFGASTRSLVARLAREGITARQVGAAPVLVVAGASDIAVGRRMKQRVALIEHGAGQVYRQLDGAPPSNPSYAGGEGREEVSLFLCPRQEIADANLSRYPTARAAVVGAPKLDDMPHPPKDGPVCISWHWNATFVPEARWSWPHYSRSLKMLAEQMPGLVGHAHPRALDRIAPFYRRAGIEVVEDFRDVCARASTYCVDNSCVVPDTPVLCKDLRWRPAGELVPGDELVGCDEERFVEQPHATMGTITRERRHFRTATVTTNDRRMLPCYRVRTTHGEMVVSENHPWLARGVITYDYLVANRKGEKTWKHRSHHDRWEWRATASLKVGDRVAFFAEPWSTDESRDAGWLAGMFDGEGTLHYAQAGKTGTRRMALSVSQNEGLVLDEIRRVLSDRKLHATEQDRIRCHKLTIGGSLADRLRLLGEVRPVRLLAKAIREEVWSGYEVTPQVTTAEVLEMEYLGPREVCVLATSERTFIAGGFMAHNSTMYEFAALGGRVVALNAPWYRRDVEHGLRFWSAIPGPQADGPDDVAACVAEAAKPEWEARRAEGTRAIYGVLGGATERALAALRLELHAPATTISS